MGTAVDHLKSRVFTRMASGPLRGEAKRAGFVIFQAADRAEGEALVAADPFALHGLVERLEIHEWDPPFGAFAAQASGELPGPGKV